MSWFTWMSAFRPSANAHKACSTGQDRGEGWYHCPDCTSCTGCNTVVPVWRRCPGGLVTGCSSSSSRTYRCCNRNSDRLWFVVVWRPQNCIRAQQVLACTFRAMLYSPNVGGEVHHGQDDPNSGRGIPLKEDTCHGRVQFLARQYLLSATVQNVQKKRIIHGTGVKQSIGYITQRRLVLFQNVVHRQCRCGLFHRVGRNTGEGWGRGTAHGVQVGRCKPQGLPGHCAYLTETTQPLLMISHIV